MNRTALMPLISLLAAMSVAPAIAMADRDGGFSRDRQDQTRSEQRDTGRSDVNRSHDTRQTPQYDSQRKSTRQQTKQPVIQQKRPVTIEHRRTPRMEQRSTIKPQRREVERRRTFEPQRRHVETRRYRVEPGHEYREHYFYRPVPRDRYYFGIHIYRHYGHRYPGFGFYYSDHDAMRFLAFTALTLAIINHVDEHAQRLHEQALIRATSAGIGDTVYWDEGDSHGSVTVEDIWYDNRGRECRELEQRVISHGLIESSRSTVCKKPDGIWVVPAR